MLFILMTFNLLISQEKKFVSVTYQIWLINIRLVNGYGFIDKFLHELFKLVTNLNSQHELLNKFTSPFIYDSCNLSFNCTGVL